MGNSSSSGSRHQDDTVDYGALVPQGVYTGPRDWNQAIVSQFIAQRKLAPFYRPLEDYEDEWDDDQILAARKEFPDPNAEQADSTIISSSVSQPTSASSVHSSSKSVHGKRPSSAREFRPEAAVYRGAVECPICFLYYPRNINHSRCCDQAICTECFVQIKRAEPTTTHLVSEPAACPYCVQEDFGIVYKPPLWRSGIGSDGYTPLTPADVRSIDQPAAPGHKRRQRSYSAQSPEVVSIDQIRPDWEAKLAAVRAAVARRANRRIIMRQVGDRLIPVGIGRVHDEAEGAEGGSGSRRRRNRNPPGELAQYLGMGGQDLEELMLMEAMRLSLIDHEEQQRKEAEEKKKKEEIERAAAGQESSLSHNDASASTNASSPIPVLGASNLAPTSGNGQVSSHSRTLEPSPPSTRTPPPFSTLNAALLTSGTASAFLGPATTSQSSDSGAPAIPMYSSDAGGSSLSGSTSDSSTIGSGTYGTLPSSPDSGNTPLLGNGISSTLETAAKKPEANSDTASRS